MDELQAAYKTVVRDMSRARVVAGKAVLCLLVGRLYLAGSRIVGPLLGPSTTCLHKTEPLCKHVSMRCGRCGWQSAYGTDHAASEAAAQEGSMAASIPATSTRGLDTGALIEGDEEGDAAPGGASKGNAAGWINVQLMLEEVGWQRVGAQGGILGCGHAR